MSSIAPAIDGSI